MNQRRGQEPSFKAVAAVVGALFALLLIVGMLRLAYTAATGTAVPEASSPAEPSSLPAASSPPDSLDPLTPAAPSISAAGEAVSVSHVVDGDTFKTRDGRTVRVLGIDACESNSAGGIEASADARQILYLGDVTLTQEPGVTTDGYGRDLRYVQVNGRDFGREMVVHDHTAVYVGRNDANPAYIAGLRVADPNSRTCEASYVPPPPRPYVPAPDPGDRDSRRSGDSGHPCLPDERDGDGDGYCGEGR